MIDRENLNRLADYRRRMGLTQALLAYQLGTTRVQITLAEKGLRLLSPESELKFIELMKLNPPPTNLPVGYHQQLMVMAEDEAYRQSIIRRQWRLDEVRHFGNNLKKKLATYKERFEKESRTIRLLEAAIAENPGHSGYIAQRDKLVRKIRSCDLLVQYDLQYQIDRFKLEEKFLEWQFGQMKGSPQPETNTEMGSDLSSEQMLLTERFDEIVTQQEDVAPGEPVSNVKSTLPEKAGDMPEGF